MGGTAYENMTEVEKERYDWVQEIYDISARSGLTEDGSKKYLAAQDADKAVNDLETEYEKVLNDEFEYNAMCDPLFQQYAAQYMQEGQMAMKNAIAESSILTGGYGNSWAMSAGAQAFNSQMDTLYGLIPELRAASYDEWATDKQIKLKSLSEDLDEAGELADAANADYEAALADSRSEIIDYIAQGVMSGVITEDEIPTILPLYDNEFTEEEINALTEDILGAVEIYKLKEAELNGIITNIKADIIKNPEHNTEEYITAELAKNGLNYEDVKDSLGIGDAYEFYGGKTPTGTMMDEAAELYYQYGMEGIDRWAAKYPDYSVEKAIDHVLMEHPDIWEVTENEDGYSTSEKLLKDRVWTVTDNGGVNWFGGLDNNAYVKDQYNNEYKLKDLVDEMVKDGSFKTAEEAKKWLVDQKFGVKGGQLAKEEE